MIQIRHLSHNFGSYWALKDCSFSLAKGDFLFLSGPSGAGKTTLLKLLYGAIPLKQGEGFVANIKLNNINSNDLTTLRRQLGVVFQDFKILPDRSVQKNIALPLEVRGLAAKHIERRVRAVARALGIEKRLDMKCGVLSGGEQQRVAIARTFVVNPLLILADEPTGNLDEELSHRLMDLFMQFQVYGTTIVFATHNKELIKRHPEAKIIKLEDGIITGANFGGAKVFNKDV